MAAATIMIIKVPSNAFAMPPPVSPTGFGTLVKKCQLIFVMPALIIKSNIAINGKTQDTASVIVSA